MENQLKNHLYQQIPLFVGNYAICEQFYLNTLNLKEFLIINRTLFQTIGLLEAIVLSELINEYTYFKQTHQLQSDDGFCITNEDLQHKLNLTEYRRKQVIASLKAQDLISTTIRGVPPKTYYHIHFESLLQNQQPAIKNNPSTEGFIYLLQSQHGYKLGKTQHPEQRYSMLQMNLPFEITFIHVAKYKNYAEIEKQLHQKFAHKQINGEWFALSQKDINIIKTYKQGEILERWQTIPYT